MTIFKITLVITKVILWVVFWKVSNEKVQSCFGGLILILIFIALDKDSLIYKHNTSPSYTEQTISSIRSGSEPRKKIVIIQTSLGKRKINIVTHRRLEKFFPIKKGGLLIKKNEKKYIKQR
jgi:hypothetical protein